MLLSSDIGDVMAAENFTDPYPLYARLRRHAPVHWSDSAHCWLVTRHEDVRRLLSDPGLRSRDKTAQVAAMEPDLRTAVEPVESWLNLWMAFCDPPVHTLLKSPLKQAFTPAAARADAAGLDRLARTLAAGLGPGRHDLLADFAVPFAVRATCSMLGVESAEESQVLAWSAAVMGYLTSPGFQVSAAEGVTAALGPLRAYLTDVLMPRRGSQVAGIMHDLWRTGELSLDQVTALFAQLLTGGVEPVSTAIAVAALGLFADPLLVDAVRSGGVRPEAVVAEALRHDASFHFASRIAVDELVVDGRRIAAGAPVKLVIASANRDEAVFPDGERFDPRRPEGAGAALTFSRGIHHCLGRSAAVVQIEATVRALLDRPVPPRPDGPGERLPSFGSTAFAAVPFLF
ncbi:cytochrome P450 [Kitasatospora sp. NPDC049258]|uniref:cytochrome P450 n=1 Tax=Kitasatospora sp. NPDC049258 TaxID=3155394 RepID=UPI00343DB280